MIDFTCKKCGNPKLEKKNGMYYCPFCGSIFLPDIHEQKAMQMGSKAANCSTSIDLRGDIDILLEKCKTEPENARKYANRILDIDPTNIEAIIYLYK